MILNENKLPTLPLVSVRKVYRKKAAGLVAHAGILLNFASGERLVLHTTPEHNTKLCTVDEFAAGQKVVSKSTVKATATIVARINLRLSNSSKYSVMTNNCEQLVSGILTGNATSTQLKTTITSSVLGTLLVASSPNNRTVTKLFGAAAGFALLGMYIGRESQLSS
jgi:hypothetical protein